MISLNPYELHNKCLLNGAVTLSTLSQFMQYVTADTMLSKIIIRSVLKRSINDTLSTLIDNKLILNAISEIASALVG